MTDREALDRTGKALTWATDDLRAFSGELLPKLAAAGAGEEGDAVLASQMVKQFVGYVAGSFPAPAARRAVAEALESMAASLRSAVGAGK